jgi:hypothetical protein
LHRQSGIMFSPLNNQNYYFHNPNLTVTNYFEGVVNELDLKAETLLAELSTTVFTTEAEHSSLGAKKQNVNSIRDVFITEIRKIEKENLDRLKLLYQQQQSESMANYKPERIFKKFCFLIDKSCFQLELVANNSFLKNKKFELGILIMTSEFIEADEINDLKKVLRLSLENKSLLSYFFEMNSETKNVSDFFFFINFYICYAMNLKRGM